MTQATFVQIPIELIRYVRSLNLSGTQYELWLYLWEKDPFGDRFVNIPSPEVIAAELGVNSRTIQRAAQRLQDADLFNFQVDVWKCRNTTVTVSSVSQNKRIRTSTKRSYGRHFDPNVNETIQMSASGSKDPNLTIELGLSNDCELPQTIQIIQTNQIGVADEKVERKCAPIQDEEQCESHFDTSPVEIQSTSPEVQPSAHDSAPTKQTTSAWSSVSNCIVNSLNPGQGKTSAPRSDNDFQIPSDLRAKLQKLQIPLDSLVLRAIASHDLSQAYGAATHVERTWSTINNPRGVFLFQIGRQPQEPMGSRLRVRTAADFGYTLEHLQKIYPNNWQDAARHFGLEVA